MKKPVPVELLEKYIKGECTQAEQTLVKQWYASFEHEPDGISDMSFAEEQELEEHLYQKILFDIARAEGETEAPIQPITRNVGIWYKLAGAAAVIFVLGAVAMLYTAKIKNASDGPDPEKHIIVVTNNSNQIYKSNLPDHSSVWLSPHSQLRFPEKFAAASRNVSMQGECFFEISKNPKRPFIINSNAMITKVWGTSFLVRDNALSNQADVSVLTGKVSVAIKSNHVASLKLEKGEVMLYPHQKVICLVAQHVLKMQEAVNEPALQIWNRVNLSFDNKPLNEIIPVLNATYHVHIKAGSAKINHYVLTADLAGFNMADVLEALKKTLNVNYQIKKDSIELI
ncbi:FecR family protein [Mucilaginibacter jinjuensis]|uniref:FecR family protein n=1 Tax=Mucilaginibacter jinjuensis TaxID=1176721 RepID=A0ABY7T4P2_9SPHI|nr:FecR family protein [Mucilaginibacter jinjuensis]WCT11429.1 FecR family protein [Mucilaginibacter jinjuensis]